MSDSTPARRSDAVELPIVTRRYAHITALQAETPGVMHVVLEVQRPGLRWLPGQWVDLQITLDGEAHIGGYSMISPWDPDTPTRLELAIRRSRHRVSAWMHDEAQVGDQVILTGGDGPCVYDPEIEPDAVWVAGGIGITPLLAMVKAFVARPEIEGRGVLMYSVKSPEAHPFSEVIDALAADARLQVHTTFTESGPEGTHRGRLSAHDILAVCPSERAPIYLSGPPAMVDDLEQQLWVQGVSADRIRLERWW
ncbi:MAG: ferredoxin--NADP reductase [Bradymonadia bacterium]